MKDLFELTDIDQNPMQNRCTYASPDDVNLKGINVSGSQLSILHLNIHSLPSKLDEITDLLAKLRSRNIAIDIILLCGTFI